MTQGHDRLTGFRAIIGRGKRGQQLLSPCHDGQLTVEAAEPAGLQQCDDEGTGRGAHDPIGSGQVDALLAHLVQIRNASGYEEHPTTTQGHAEPESIGP